MLKLHTKKTRLHRQVASLEVLPVSPERRACPTRRREGDVRVAAGAARVLPPWHPYPVDFAALFEKFLDVALIASPRDALHLYVARSVAVGGGGRGVGVGELQ